MWTFKSSKECKMRQFFFKKRQKPPKCVVLPTQRLDLPNCSVFRMQVGSRFYRVGNSHSWTKVCDLNRKHQFSLSVPIFNDSLMICEISAILIVATSYTILK